MTEIPQLEDGVYVDLPAKIYFGQKDRRGSSDWGALDERGLGWWWSSEYNPRHAPRPKTDPNLNYGSALHTIMLEGLRIYEARYITSPDRLAYPGLVDSIEEMQTKLRDEGFELLGSSKFRKPDWAREMRAHLPDVPCWSTILEEFEAVAGDRERVSADEDWTLRFMLDMALDESRSDNQAVRKLLTPTDDDPALAEVSVFATIEGIKRRWRFDRLFLGATMDLKSMAGWRGRPLAFEIGEVAARNRWIVQRADYDIGRMQARELIQQGRLFGGDLDQRRHLQKIANSQDDWFWLWLVYQKPAGTGSAPILMPIHDRTGSDRHMDGRIKLERAIRLYRDAIAEFGLERPWGRVEPLHYTEERIVNKVSLPRIHFPHWVGEDQPTEAAAYHNHTEEES